MKRRDDNGFWASVAIVLFAILLVWLICRVAVGDGKDGGVREEQRKEKIVEDPKEREEATSDKEAGVESEADEMLAREALQILALPYFEDDQYVVECDEGDYVFHYNTTYCQSDWVAYLLTSDDVATRGADRADRFLTDDKVKSRGWDWATTSDYTNSGYDRGHLCPSADRNDTEEENRATFYMSNISPQTPSLNRGVWKDLEEQVRRWAAQYDSVYVVAGGILNDEDLESFNGIGVPEMFYKVLLAHEEGEWQSCGFLMPNTERVSGEWSDYAVTVDEVERAAGFDFYYRLPDGVESMSEKQIGYIFR